jgi:hypothetical protein
MAAERQSPIVADEELRDATCTECGCTEMGCCEGGCFWVEVDREKGTGICSRCKQMSGEETRPSRPINKLWAVYRQMIPRDATLTQIKETRRAFYSGAAAMFQFMVTISEQDEGKATVAMTAIDDEVRAFFAGVGNADDQN